ncbi:MAG: DUF1015 family protein [Acidimicrobiales bacterium]|nr:DUF1015 family protein [Acidimicrobiales bacterium]
MVHFAPLRLRLIDPAWTNRVPSPAHDSLTPRQRMQHLAAFPDSYLAVTRSPEDSADGRLSLDEALREGRRALDRLLEEEAFSEVRGDLFYVYRLEVDGWGQSGLVGGIHMDDYTTGSLRIHEAIYTDRARYLAKHSDVVGAQSSPVTVSHHPDPVVAGIVQETMNGTPLIDFVMEDGLSQTVWEVNPSHELAIRNALADASLYLIDGHHRTAAADLRHQAGASPWLLAAIFPTDQLKNTAFHRVCSEVDSLALWALRQLPGAKEGRIGDGVGTVQVHYQDQWLTIPHIPAQRPLERLDTWQFETMIRPHLGPDVIVKYQNAQGDEQNLLDQVTKDGDLLALMTPVTMANLFAVADARDVMPPKSTYFEPKVRSGIFLRHLESEDVTSEEPRP